MSRCFPYPLPSGYLRNGARGEGVSDRLIKHQREGVKAIPEHPEHLTRKEKKRDKKDGRKDKKQKVDKTTYVGAKCNQKEEGFSQVREDSEKSDVTEEHGQPVPSCYLSDGNHGLNKRKRDETVSSDDRPRNVLRIRLSSLQKHKDSTSQPLLGTIDPIKTIPATLPTLIPTTVEHVSRPEDTTCSPVMVHENPKRRKHEKKREKLFSQYDALFNTWVPPTVNFEIQDDDEDWLFGSKTQERDCTKSFVADHNKASCVSSVSTLFPRAQLLEEANIYALPFTVPF